MSDYAALFDRFRDAVVIANAESQIIFANPAAEALFPEQLALLLAPLATAALTLYEVDAPQGTRELAYPMGQILGGQSFYNQEFLLRSPQPNSDIWLAMTGYPITLSSGTPGGLLMIRNISDHKAIALEHLRASFRDSLTGLVNRTVLMDRIEHALRRAQRREQTLIAILCLDIKRLKAVNDTFGYGAGDQLLVAVADRLTQILRPEDTLSRLGGDDFTLLIEEVSSYSQIIAIAATIHEALVPPFILEGHDIHVDVNIGISLSNRTCQDAATLLRQADIAMNRAKSSFGEQYCVFEDSMKSDAEDSLYLEMALKKAIENQELFLEYQPIFLIRNQVVIGMESLVRWQHPEHGLMPPSQFIPLAEKTGLIIPLGWWVLEESCRQLKVWQQTLPNTHHLFVSVNMSSKQFTQKDVPGKIEQILHQVDLAPSNLKLEITEGVLIENSTSIVEILKAIRAMGIKLSIDDFGTGYSSLSYLHKFPFDTLKIDRSFLENADSDFEKLEILQAMVRLAWNLGLEVVAEGIETPKHFAQIKALRCESGQGYLFSKPLGVAAMESLLSRP
ncbi:MAG TPA: EAL domain-containing protein [Candidatus Obscuribacterales bacterium]